jgi:cholesterol transport system auxiliary component
MNMASRMVALIVSASVLLGGCGTVAPVPDHTYYRLSRPEALPVSERQSFEVPVVVGLFAADGLYADRALIYALDPEARELRQYHYQLWTDPPTRLLQRRLQYLLRESAIAPLVIDELAASQDALRISGVILRFERVPTDDGRQLAAVALKIRANRPDGTPLIDEVYRADEPAADLRLGSTVDALGRAIDRIFAEFHADLLRQAGAFHVR